MPAKPKTPNSQPGSKKKREKKMPLLYEISVIILHDVDGGQQ
jgi:hypothetical protein